MYDYDPDALGDAPDILGLSFRHFRGDEDYPAMVEVNNASKIADGLQHDLHTVETLRHVYRQTEGHDPYKDVLIAEIDGKMVAYNRVFLEPELNGPYIYWHFGFVVPEWRGYGLGKCMIHWAERRARLKDREQPEARTAYASTEVHAGQPGLENLLKSVGYEPVRYQYHMETPDLDHILDAPVPEGLELRPAKPAQYRAIWAANVEAFRDHWGTSEDGEDYDVWLNHPFMQPELWVVAWDGDQVAGSILNFINHDYNEREGRKLGYTEWITVRRPWRRRGVARAMLARSMHLLKSQGMTQTALSVDTQNPSGALQLYESMGYRMVSQSTTYRKRL